MENYISKICPYCNTVINEGDAVKVCPACGVMHHQRCWEENNGCTTYGCPEQHSGTQGANQTDFCQNCGATMGYGQAFCPKCGAPKVEAKKNVCNNCGAELQVGQDTCQVCGQKVGSAIVVGGNNAINPIYKGVQNDNKKKIMLPIIIVAAVAVVAVVAVVLFLLLKTPSVEEIVLSKSSVELKAGDSTSVSYTITPDKASEAEVTWKSSDNSVATVNSRGKITGKGDGSCTITVTADGKKDSLTVTVKTGPDFKAIYDEYCESTWATYGDDGSYLRVDTNPYDWEDDGLAYMEAYEAVEDINEELGLPASLLNDMGETTGADGKQSETFDDIGITVTWRYHPDNGLEVTYKTN